MDQIAYGAGYEYELVRTSLLQMSSTHADIVCEQCVQSQHYKPFRLSKHFPNVLFCLTLYIYIYCFFPFPSLPTIVCR